MELSKFGRHTNIFVGFVLGVGGLLAFYHLLSLPWFLFVLGLISYEAWTLLNKEKYDTISESIWRLNQRPLVPWLFGLFAGWLVMSETIPQTREGLFIALFYGLLQGHFFFSRQCKVTAESAESEKS